MELGMRIGSLFAGIGGFDLAAEWTGWETAWYAEIDPYASAVMAKRYSHATNHGDIRTIDGRAVEHVELLCGGFPCQDISLAGKGAGLSGERSGLWHHYARLIEEIRPRWVVIENVSALRSRGLDTVLGALAALGYDAEWHCIPAAYVGAPHRRDRIWIVAWRADCRDVPNALGDNIRLEQQRVSARRPGGVPDQGQAVAGYDGAAQPVADANGAGCGERRGAVTVSAKLDPAQCSGEAVADADRNAGHERRASDAAQEQGGRDVDRSGIGAGELADADSFRCDARAIPRRGETKQTGARQTVGGSSWWLAEPNVGRVAHGVPARVDRLRCLGNAIVPQVAYLIFQAIEAVEVAERESAREAA